MQELKNMNVIVFGLGKSGIAAAKRLVSLGAKVALTEVKPESDFSPDLLQELKGLGIQLELGGHNEESVNSADLIVVSPGVHLDIPVLRQTKTSVISEIELAYQLLKKPIIAVTGTNGKTTTTTLIGEMLKAGGKKIAVAGNIGNPLVAVEDADLDFIVAEISSYQLEAIKDFRPWISVILNIQEDHLERHHSRSEYIEQKKRIFLNQTSNDYLIYNLDDPLVVEMAKQAKAKLIAFSKKQPDIIALGSNEIKIPGEHNLANSLAAAQAAYLCGIAKATVAKVLKTFPGIEHRIEYVRTINGVEFYNDSKATNPDSTLVALRTFKGRTSVLILGGKDKGTGLESLAQETKKSSRAVVLIGEASSRFETSLQAVGFEAIQRTDSMANAVKKSFSLAKKNDIVLLSPACASFDMFSGFEERGKVFKEAVSRL
ncbi:UDP-N-acetylmuramoyl-L-alanine--D-glutamate ligase [Candidatus Margulisiibacteriota bacterium]